MWSVSAIRFKLIRLGGNLHNILLASTVRHQRKNHPLETYIFARRRSRSSQLSSCFIFNLPHKRSNPRRQKNSIVGGTSISHTAFFFAHHLHFLCVVQATYNFCQQGRKGVNFPNYRITKRLCLRL